jgi:hypothetical protein
MPAEPDRLRFLRGRSRNRVHLIPWWQDSQPWRESRCGLLGIPSDWWGGDSPEEEASAAHRPVCRNCARNYEINEGKPYFGEERESA